jgi:glutathione S-transferase
LQALRPLGAAPVIEDGDLLLVELDPLMAVVKNRLGEARYFAGETCTAADIMSVSSLTTMRLFQPLDLGPYPNIRACLQRIGQRPAYQRAMAKGDPDRVPMLG